MSAWEWVHQPAVWPWAYWGGTAISIVGLIVGLACIALGVWERDDAT